MTEKKIIDDLKELVELYKNTGYSSMNLSLLEHILKTDENKSDDYTIESISNASLKLLSNEQLLDLFESYVMGFETASDDFEENEICYEMTKQELLLRLSNDEDKVIEWVNDILRERGYTSQDFFLTENEKEELRELIKQLK